MPCFEGSLASTSMGGLTVVYSAEESLYDTVLPFSISFISDVSGFELFRLFVD